MATSQTQRPYKANPPKIYQRNPESAGEQPVLDKEWLYKPSEVNKHLINRTGETKWT
jgi:hypothetical protein